MDEEARIMELVSRLRRDMPRNTSVSELCNFVEILLTDTVRVRTKLSANEKRKRNTERVRRWRASQKNPFEDV